MDPQSLTEERMTPPGEESRETPRQTFGPWRSGRSTNDASGAA
jgi:hypothetical protein